MDCMWLLGMRKRSLWLQYLNEKVDNYFPLATELVSTSVGAMLSFESGLMRGNIESDSLEAIRLLNREQSNCSLVEVLNFLFYFFEKLGSKDFSIKTLFQDLKFISIVLSSRLCQRDRY